MKLIFKSSLMLLCMFALAACTVAKTPGQGVYQIQGDYNAAVSLETKYDKLPDCGIANAPVLCSKHATIKLVRQIDNAAYDSIMNAQTIVRSEGPTSAKAISALAAASSTVTAFTNIIASTGVK